MKKVLFLIFASLLVLGACGNNNKSTEKVSEDKPQFKNDTLVLDQAVLYIKDAFIVKNKDTGKKEIAFKYEVKNKTDKEEITPGNVWSAGVEVKQEEDNTDSNLDTGTTIASGGKYKEWTDHNNDSIKKNKTAKGLESFELKGNGKVTLHFTQGAGGKDLGTKHYDLSKLQTVNYSTEEDVASTSTSEDNSSDDENSYKAETTSKSESGKAKSTNSSHEKTQEQQVATQDTGNQQKNSQQTQNSNTNNEAFSSNGYHKVYNQADPDMVEHNDQQVVKWKNQMVEHNKNFNPRSGGDLYNIETGNFVSEE